MIFRKIQLRDQRFLLKLTVVGCWRTPMPSLDAIGLQTIMSCGGLPHVPSLQKHDSLPGKSKILLSPKRVCTEYRSVLVERNSFTSPVKDRLLGINNFKSKAAITSFAVRICQDINDILIYNEMSVFSGDGGVQREGRKKMRMGHLYFLFFYCSGAI
ncbi:putative retinoblastoma protein family [Helianthus annuus]|nr:putative retinoblastoma protein family [Helianthus annuus]KAJ0619416.1 putative retinoblastoma protein family [Helianthus annuus]KAJ0940714.1 putative retinoblastoma protein family [Helianthus annuus]